MEGGGDEKSGDLGGGKLRVVVRLVLEHYIFKIYYKRLCKS